MALFERIKAFFMTVILFFFTLFSGGTKPLADPTLNPDPAPLLSLNDCKRKGIAHKTPFIRIKARSGAIRYGLSVYHETRFCLYFMGIRFFCVKNISTQASR